MARQYILQRAPSAAGIRIDYAAELNPQQHAAVTASPGAAPRASPPAFCSKQVAASAAILVLALWPLPKALL